MMHVLKQTRRPDAVYIFAALLALAAHGAVFALSWQSPPSVKLQVQGAPGVEIRLAQLAAAPEPEPAPEPERQPKPQARPAAPAPKPTPQKRQPAPKQSQPRQSAPAAVTAPEPASAQIATSPEPLASLDNKQPRYPSLAQKRGQEGNVTLLVKVDADGAVKSVTVQNGSGHSLLDKAAADAVKKWRFSPARLGGRPVAGSAMVTVEFRLE